MNPPAMSSLGDVFHDRMYDDVPAVEGRPLHSPRALQLAAFFGGPLAAALLFARNFHALGRGRAALLALAIGAAVTVGLVWGALTQPLLWVLPILPSLALVVIVGYCTGTFRREYTSGAHWPASGWWVVLASVIGIVVVTGVWFAMLPLAL